ncbi:GNAT family N-acetyltransferase [Nonomuraea candida]|uniref:GNAT family N-acetyltransferase n=1 Tax=Nonomuraea candida TaxID=359159 RepID=UPI000AD867D9|nr:GNAT family N-acetyltransferase [Nonomuraea candida]
MFLSVHLHVRTNSHRRPPPHSAGGQREAPERSAGRGRRAGARCGERPFLHVAETNTGAIALYERLGFQTRRPVTFRGFRIP